MLRPDEILEWAEKVQKTVEPQPYSDEWLEEIAKTLPPVELPPMPPCVKPIPMPHVDCGCPWTTICMNTACPRAVRVTYGLNA